MISSGNMMDLALALMLAIVSSCFANPAGNDTASETGRILSASVVPAVVIQQRPENVVSSYDGGHHYEQQPNEQIRDGTKPLVQLMDVSMLSNSNNDADLYIGVSKPEPRNEIEDPVQLPQTQSTGQQDPAIIDHRPPAQQQQPSPSNLDLQQPTVASSDPGQQPTTTTQMPPQTAAPAVTSQPIITYNVAPQITATSAPANQSQPAANQVPNSQPQPAPQPQNQAPGQITQAKQPQPITPTWYSGPAALNYQQTTADASSGSQMVSASNQVMTSVQHPNSINAIITSDNQARSMQSNAIPVQQHQHQLQAAPAQQIVTVNGQQMLLVNPNTLHTGGRRISISGWLKNISSILTNIFNRREHGPATNAHGQVSAGPLSHWMLGSGLGSHSWLSGAQQMVQQPYMMLGSNRHQHQSSLNYAQQPAPQQQLPADLQTSASSNSFATITSPQASYQPAAQVIQLSQVPATAAGSVVRQAAPPMPLQQSQQIHSSIISQPSPVASMTLQNNQPAGNRPASVVTSPTSSIVQQNTAQSIVRSNRSPSNSGLPLAHYSRYNNMD